MERNEFHAPLISVILPVYNRKYILKRALDSIIKQTFKNFELIIIDDGSTDNVKELISVYLNKHKNFKYFRYSNQGVALSRNKGISLSQGIYVTFIDSDDEYKKTHLEKMICFMENNPDLDFIHQLPDIIGNKKDYWLVSSMDTNKLIHVNDCVYGATFFAKKRVFTELNGFRKMVYGEDSDFYNRLSSQNKFKIKKLDERTYIYHRNVEDSICNLMKKQLKSKAHNQL